MNRKRPTPDRLTHPESSTNEVYVASFRDPSGRLLCVNDRILRFVNRQGVDELNTFLASKTFQDFSEREAIVKTDFLDEEESLAFLAGDLVGQFVADGYDPRRELTVVEHERIRFQSFPYEWPPEMLHVAAVLTLDLMESLLGEGLGMKDATPYNVLFRGPQAVFVDLLSFEKRQAGDPIWSACAQFERTFLLPLLVNKYFGRPLDQLLTTRRDGLEPEEIYKICGFWKRFHPAFLTRVSIPTWLANRHNADNASIYQQRLLDNHEKARFILAALLKRLRGTLERLRPKGGKQSTWSDYLDANNNYTTAHFQAKEAFVDAALQELKPESVLDVGCNTGHFSAIAARRGACVVALDTDSVVVGDVWRRANREKLNILPLVVNLARPSPATGWRNQECPSFISRARGRFDAVLMLAVLHHLLVTERIPLVEILDLAAELTNDALIIEFVAPDDSMFRRLTRGRDHLHKDLTPERFEAECRRKFTIVRVQHVEETSRWLYLLRKK